MKLFKADESKRVIVTNPSVCEPQYAGKMWRQAMTDGQSYIKCGLTGFDGIPGIPHVHEYDQILVIKEGVCVCTNEAGESFEAYPGDVVLFEAGELHNHAARPDTNMRHYAITYQPDYQQK